MKYFESVGEFFDLVVFLRVSNEEDDVGTEGSLAALHHRLRGKAGKKKEAVNIISHFPAIHLFYLGYLKYDF